MKRIAVLLACLSLLLGSARAAVAVRMDDAAALLTQEGKVIVAPGAWEDIVPLGGGRFAATSDGLRYALMDEHGALLSEERYDELRLCGGLLCACRDGKWGALGGDGAELGDFDWDEILTDGEFAWALREEEDQLSIAALDSDGSARESALRAQRVGAPGCGLLPLCGESSLWGCCDARGELAIPMRFEWLGGFVAGCAPAVADGRYGAIDAKGDWIASPEYDYVEISPEGFALAVGPGGAELFSSDGSALASYPGEGVWAALAGRGYMIGDGDALRVYDAKGALLEELAPDASVSEGVGAQLVISEGVWGERCVRLSGTENPYQNLYPLGTAEGEAIYASLAVNAARYQNDLLHEIQVSVDMDSARYGLVNGAGEELLPCGYRSIQYLADDRFLVQGEGQWRIINSWGKVYWRSNTLTRTAAPNF